MTKFITIVVVIYIIYYAANIIYDIFFKKEKRTPDEEDKEEFTFNNIDDDVKVTNVGIDDVENMDMGESMEAIEDDLFSSAANIDDNETPTDTDLQAMQRKYEEEENIDNNSITNTIEKENVDDTSNSGGIAPSFPSFDKQEVLRKNRELFRNIINMAETNIQTIATADGEKIYKSMMNFNN